MPTSPHPKILLVIHDANVSRQIHAGLNLAGLSPVGEAHNDTDALALARELRPELGLVELSLSPGLGGIKVAQNLREQFDVPVIFVTERNDAPALRAAMLADPYGYVTPPYESRSWRTIIDLALYRHDAEARVRAIRDEQSAIARASMDGFWISDLFGRLLDVNDAFCHLSGYTREELLQLTIVDLTPEEDRAGVPATIEEIKRLGSVRFERRHRRKDGSCIQVGVSVTYLPTSGGRLVVFVRDDSERDRARTAAQESERARLESESQFTRVFQSSPVMMALTLFDDDTFVEVNEQFVAVSGFTREEAIGRSSTELGWVDAADRAQLVRQLEREGHLKDIEIPARTKDGRTLRVLYSGEPLNMDGRRLILSTWRDVTEQRRVQALLQLQSSALEAAANAIVITDRAGVIEWANTAFTRYSGYTRDEFIGHTFGELINSGHHDADFFARMWNTILSGAVWHGEITNRRKDDTVYVDETTITPVTSPDGTISHFIAVKQDVTQRKTLEEQFRQAQKMEAIGQLAGGVAHDFNNILAAVLMYLGILQDEPSTEPHLRETLKELHKEVKRGAGLTRQLLTFSRQQAIEKQFLDLNQVLDGLMKMLGRLLGEHIVVSVQHSIDKLPAIEADLGMMEQVIINLCVNARDAMEHGGRLTLHTAFVEFVGESPNSHPQARPGRFVRLDVSDTGCGMDDETLQRIFEPFFTTKPAGKGTGLGLATVYGIVKQHHGWVEVKSALNVGTTFSVFLPAAELAANPLEDAEAVIPVRGRGEAILVVEDDPHVRAVMVQSLRLGGYKVFEADTGPNAIKLWEENCDEIALLLTDMVMPDGMDGRMLSARLRAEEPRLRVVLCTGYNQVAAPVREGDGSTLLRKPFDTPELLRTIRAVLDAR